MIVSKPQIAFKGDTTRVVGAASGRKRGVRGTERAIAPGPKPRAETSIKT